VRRAEGIALAEPKVRVEIEADGKTRSGVLHPSGGATIEVMIADSVKGIVGFDYTKPDVLALRLGGDIRMKLGGAGKMRVEGDLEKSLRDGAMSFDGSMTWEFSKDVSVRVHTALDDSRKEAGMKVTLEFD
jgi:hypothetical protein